MTRSSPRPGKLPVLIAIATLVVACSTLDAAETSCDGITSEVGGCDDDRPVFEGESCAAIGAEIGRELDRRIVTIADGPEVADDRSRAVRASQAMSLTVSLANIRLRDLDIVEECSAADLVQAAELQFSRRMAEVAGRVLYDGATVSFSEWLSELRSLLRIVDMEEGADGPVAGSAAPPPAT